jgi:hypothetical protein
MPILSESHVFSDWHTFMLSQSFSIFFFFSPNPVTLGRRSYGDLDRHQISVMNARIVVASPQNAVESPRTPRDGVCVLLQITNAMGLPSFEKRSGSAVTTQYNRLDRRDNAVSPYSEFAVETARWPTAIAHSAFTQRLWRLHCVYRARSWRYRSVCITTPWSFHGIHPPPVRIRVSIDPPLPLVCRKRRLNGQYKMGMRPEKPRSRVTAGVAR